MTQVDDTAPATVMTDAIAEDRATGPGLGEKLRMAREQRSLSIEQAADALHLDEAVIIALEQENFATLGAPVYVHGHLKTYARILGLSADEIVRQYQDEHPEPVVAPSLPPPGLAPATANPVLWAGGVVAILLGLLLGVYVLLGVDDLDDTVAADSIVVPVAPAPPADAAVEIEAPPVAVRRTVTAPETVIKPAPPTAHTAGDEVAAVTPPPADLPVPRPAATMRLGLLFNQESWVEISDANRRLLFGLQHAGYRREITGEPPFNLLIGNAYGVNLTVNGEPFDVPVSRMRGKVAHFEITGEEFE